MSTWRHVVFASAAVAGAAFIAAAAVACGSGSSSPSSSSGSSPAATSAAATPASMADTPASGAASGTAAGNAASSPAAGGGAASGSISVGDTSLGAVLVDGANVTLYVYSKDTPGSGTSACTGACATNWPPLIVTSVPPNPAGAFGKLATITRADGSMQLTYLGQPLYRFSGDKAPGDTKGDGVGGLWSAVKP